MPRVELLSGNLQSPYAYDARHSYRRCLSIQRVRISLANCWESSRKSSAALVRCSSQRITPPRFHGTKSWNRHLNAGLPHVSTSLFQVVGSWQLTKESALYRSGALWTIRTNIVDYGLNNTLPCDFAKTTELAHMPTRLSATPAKVQERLINWGFAVADAALRAHLDSSIPCYRLPLRRRCRLNIEWEHALLCTVRAKNRSSRVGLE
jgi:hypothetical protein